MSNAAQPAAALRDRAERHVFAALGELPAIERRVLALVDLAGADRPATARDAGLTDDDLRRALARARKALRRSRAPLAGGGRCEHAELLLSDRLDGALDWRGGRWLDIHLDRCLRCREHEALLDAAWAELRTSFEAAQVEEPAAPPPAPAEPAAKLRVVPEPPAEEEPPAAEGPPAPDEPPAAEGPPAPDEPPAVAAPPSAAPPAAATATPPAPLLAPPPAEQARRLARRAAVVRAAKVIAAVLVIAALVVAAVFGIGRLGGGDDHRSAPWDRPDAPDVRPAPLSGQ